MAPPCNTPSRRTMVGKAPQFPSRRARGPTDTRGSHNTQLRFDDLRDHSGLDTLNAHCSTVETGYKVTAYKVKSDIKLSL